MPVTFVFTGVSVIFGGLYETAWREGHIKWGSHRTFFTEEVQIVENRPISKSTPAFDIPVAIKRDFLYMLIIDKLFIGCSRCFTFK